MEFTSKINSVRVSPRKMGEIASEIRRKNINTALNYLSLSPKKNMATVLAKLLRNAVSNANRKGTVDVDRLFVKLVLVNPGMIIKRYRARAKGSGTRINKKTCHVSVMLTEE